ncbi:MAG: glycosyl hydrolase family 88, partial [Gemmiger sp.]|nr:glycosyl hydrolase family 88 [Gemmiger sp.]
MTHEEIMKTLGDYVDYLIAGSTAEAPLWNIEKVRSGKPNKWNYIDGCMITACLSLYETTGEARYLDFSKAFLDYFVQEDGKILT